MIYATGSVGSVDDGRAARLLPWGSLEGKPCYLLADGSGGGYVSRVADNVESVQLGMAGDLLDHAVDLLDDSEATADQLHFLASRLAESLFDVRRIARSRGARLASEGDAGDDRDDVDDEG
ncbi:hypothetical protein [Streptomyces beihaiensis]|uniref:Uncharacterized protein n=1 Tax=Streptomyces beihaiensis TaxID=2984495 RepID=A0ABT3TR50_9ACTN|nr:hypothetical protein [Streptomyces beihaiensis]MCX3058513.1 hypothetical protein [Streptomyces beihaiensis]